MTAILALAVVAGLVAPSPSPSPSAASDAKTILDRAIAARGGEEALKRATALEWRGRAMTYGGERRTDIEGQWVVEPPHRLFTATREVGTGKPWTRHLAHPGRAAGVERDLLDLYAILRLVPLREPGVRLTATGPRSLRAESDGRPPVDLTFDGTGWLDRIRTEVLDPATGRMVLQEVTLAGEVAGGGIRWPRRINISRDGAPFLDLDIETFGVVTPETLTKEAAKKPRD